MDAATGFVLGVLFSWYFWPICFLAALFFESFEKNVMSVGLAILAIVGVSGFFSIESWSWATLGIIFLSYIALGFMHSIWRWYRYVDDRVERFAAELPELKKNVADGEHNAEPQLARAVETHKERTNYRTRLDTLAYWVLMWPISGLAHLFGDIVKLIQKTFSTFFSSLFDRITNRANAKLDIDLDNPLGKNTNNV